jgi:hypothetical protein
MTAVHMPLPLWGMIVGLPSALGSFRARAPLKVGQSGYIGFWTNKLEKKGKRPSQIDREKGVT